VVNQDSNTVTPIDTATNAPEPTIAVASDPAAIAITPNGNTAYVTSFGTGIGGDVGSVTPISTTTNTAGLAIPLGGSSPNSPVAIAITPNGATAYVVNRDSNTVTPISTATNTAGAAIPVGQQPLAIAITPNGATAYVVNSTSNTVTPISTATKTPGTPIPVGNSPNAIAITPNGKSVYVTNFDSDTVTPINIANNTAGTAITVGAAPRAIAITPAGKTAYVVNSSATYVTPINTATNTAGTDISLGGDGPYAITIPERVGLVVGQWPGTAGPGIADAYYGYPYPDPPACTDGGSCVEDKWYFYEGQCTSWVAYRINQLSGVPFNNYYDGSSTNTWGDASNWGPHARNLGIPVNATPSLGSVAWYSSDHVAYVEWVNSPTSVVISEMNYDNDNGFRVRTITKSNGWPTDFIHIPGA
jgi:YVTN family beta-propeller protein